MEDEFTEVGEEQRGLNVHERSLLLWHARESLICAVKKEPLPSLDDPPPRLLDQAAAFVSLHRRDQLRGCVGILSATKPLATVVSEMTIAAALKDPRFPPVRTEELSSLDIEISVLSPPKPIAPHQVVPGKHGLVVSRAGKRGVLLPQVATTHGWDGETFLSHTCIKAGLPPDAWKQPETSLLGFTAQVFGELAPAS